MVATPKRHVFLFAAVVFYGCINHSIVINNKIKNGSSQTLLPAGRYPLIGPLFPDSSILHPLYFFPFSAGPQSVGGHSSIFIEAYASTGKTIYNITQSAIDSNID